MVLQVHTICEAIQKMTDPILKQKYIPFALLHHNLLQLMEAQKSCKPLKRRVLIDNTFHSCGITLKNSPGTLNYALRKQNIMLDSQKLLGA